VTSQVHPCPKVPPCPHEPYNFLSSRPRVLHTTALIGKGGDDSVYIVLVIKAMSKYQPFGMDFSLL